MNIMPLDSRFREQVNAYVRYLWGGPQIVSRGRMYDTRDLPGFVAEGTSPLPTSLSLTFGLQV